MNDEMIRKLHDVFARKMQEVYEKNPCPDPFRDQKIHEFNAWQNYLNNTLSLEVVDVEEGGQAGLVRLGGGARVVRIMNPSNAVGRSREFIVIPYEIAERILVLEWIPDDLRTPDG